MRPLRYIIYQCPGVEHLHLNPPFCPFLLFERNKTTKPSTCALYSMNSSLLRNIIIPISYLSPEPIRTFHQNNLTSAFLLNNLSYIPHLLVPFTNKHIEMLTYTACLYFIIPHLLSQSGACPRLKCLIEVTKNSM